MTEHEQSSCSDGFSKCSLLRPAIKQSRTDGSFSKANGLIPCSTAHCFSIECYHSIHASISHLLFLSGPSAVFRFVVFGIIFAFNRMMCSRPRPHVQKEVLEGVQPSFANPYPSPAVVFPVSSRRAFTLAANVGPHTVFRRKVQTVFCLPSRHFFDMEAATRLRATVAVRKAGASYDNFFSAITKALPEMRKGAVGFKPFPKVSLDRKAKKLLTSDVSKLLAIWWWARNYRIRCDVFRHIVFSKAVSYREAVLASLFYRFQTERQA